MQKIVFFASAVYTYIYYLDITYVPTCTYPNPMQMIDKISYADFQYRKSFPVERKRVIKPKHLEFELPTNFNIYCIFFGAFQLLINASARLSHFRRVIIHILSYRYAKIWWVMICWGLHPLSFFYCCLRSSIIKKRVFKCAETLYFHLGNIFW